MKLVVPLLAHLSLTITPKIWTWFFVSQLNFT